MKRKHVSILFSDFHPNNSRSGRQLIQKSEISVRQSKERLFLLNTYKQSYVFSYKYSFE